VCTVSRGQILREVKRSMRSSAQYLVAILPQSCTAIADLLSIRGRSFLSALWLAADILETPSAFSGEAVLFSSRGLVPHHNL
jgi:hypothetical protein